MNATPEESSGEEPAPAVPGQTSATDPTVAGGGALSASGAQADTRAEISRLAARGYIKVRHIIAQLPNTEPSRTSTVGKAVTRRKHRALLLYLLLLTCWPWLETRRQPLAAQVWIRALTAPGGLTWNASTLSHAWGDLEELGLITRKRSGRAAEVRPRREDGAADYTVPVGARDRWNTYFVLPDDFWLEETFAKLTLPGLAMLLIIASETSKKFEFPFTYANIDAWYGISARSALNGIRNLEQHGLVHKRDELIKAALSPTGYTTRSYYSLTGNYGQEARAAMQTRAKAERQARTTPKTAKTKTKKPKTTPRGTSKRRTTGDPALGRRRRTSARGAANPTGAAARRLRSARRRTGE